MYSFSHIFNQSILESRLTNITIDKIPNIEEKKQIIQQWQYNINNGDLTRTREIALQGKFLDSFFGNILGYKDMIGQNEWNIEQELSTIVDSSKPDAVLGYFTTEIKDIRAVIELKSANISLDAKQKNRKLMCTPIEQAFSYAPKYGSSCRWVIVSNFIEIRLYHSSSQLAYESFLIQDLLKDDNFIRFYYLLNMDNLLSKKKVSIIEEFYKINQAQEKKITKSFYNDYRNIRIILFKSLVQNNHYNDIVLLEKAQKILDRFIFICFSTSIGLLPTNTLTDLFEISKRSFDISNNKIWKIMKNLFQSIDIGNSSLGISKLNGGLFKNDPILDTLNIPDTALCKLENLLNYNFCSELNVNILGHIFEQSISDIECLKRNLVNDETIELDRKRKTDGIYYTPDYITQFIVYEAIHTWLDSVKKSLGEDMLPEIPITTLSNNKKNSKYNKIMRQHLGFWENYRQELSSIKVLDLTCGSGAFLNQAFDFLYLEEQNTRKILSNCRDGQISLLDLEKQILINNIYGVDLNKESVEITKLSLWIKTANKYTTLASLDNNIKCGNSIVDDPLVVGHEAFKWEKEFEEILANGGFDIIIGNPPYIDSEEMIRSQPIIREWCKRTYTCAKGNWDIFIIFIERSLNLLKQNGILSFIVPNKFLSSKYSEETRKKLLGFQIIEIRDYSSINIFEDADTYPIIFLVKKSSERLPVKMSHIRDINELPQVNFVSPSLFYKDIYWDRYFSTDKISIDIMEKLLSHPVLDTVAEVNGSATVSEAYEIKNYLEEHCEVLENSTYLKFINTGTIDRYISLWGNKDTKYIKSAYRNPIILKDDLLNLFPNRFCQSTSTKIIIGGMNKFLECYFDEGHYLAGKSTTIITNSKVNLKYILSILNSSLISYFYRTFFKSLSLNGGYLRIGPPQIKKIPLPQISKQKQIPFIELADEIIKSKLCGKRTHLLEKELDHLIYQLYGLSQDEIHYIENQRY